MDQLAQYAQLIETEIKNLDFPLSPSNLYDPLRYFLSIGGKRIRPVLALMSADLFGKAYQEALPSALSIELFHNFTLIHDDIMDAAPLRRNQATVHQKWNSNIAILSGDALFVKAYQQLAKQNPKYLPELMSVFNKTALEVCEGQQMDMDFETQNNVSIDNYLEMIRLKTSVLLGCALEMGAIVADASKQDRENIYQFGVHIGIAFQIQDDILDLYADAAEFGKQVGGDVIANKKTLLNLKAIALANDSQKNELLLLQDEKDANIKVEKTKQIYSQINVLSACEIEKEKHYQLAIDCMNRISVPAENKQVLLKLAANLMNRVV